MNTANLHSTLLCLLLMAIVTLSYSMEEAASFGSDSLSSGQKYSSCNTDPHSSVGAVQPSQISALQGGQELPTPVEDATSVLSICNSLQVIAADNVKLTPPGTYSFVFPPYSSLIASQAFVFQEPDPPQTI